MQDCNFSTVSGIKTAHTTDIYFSSNQYVTINLFNTILAADIEVSGMSGTVTGSYIKSHKHDQQEGNHYSWFVYGDATIENTIFNTAAPSLKLIPNNTTINLDDIVFQIPCDDGELVTVTIYTRWDSSNTPSQKPKVTLSGCGIVTSTATNASATTVWEQLTTSGTPSEDGCLELKVECNKSSSATNVYIDDIAVTYG
jgi:hypothetical protein